MFNNPFNRKYQNGGSTPTDEQKQDMQGFVTWIKSNVEGFKDKSEQEIAKSLSDMAKSEEGKKSVQNLYTRYQKSKTQKSKFEDGGKFQDFICKHARGGSVDCGCGGKVISAAEGIDSMPDGFLQSDTPVHAAAIAAKKTIRLPWHGIGRRRVGAAIDENGGKHFYEWGDINGNTAQTAISIPAPGDTIVKQSVATNRGWISNTYPQGTTQYETIMKRFRPIVDIGVPYKEDGGIVSEQEGGELTRKQARILSGHNKGFNRGQFQLAMANADAALRANTDLRGRELRQAKRRIVAGINPMERSVVMESTPAEVITSLPTAETISNLNPNLQFPTREIGTPKEETSTPVKSANHPTRRSNTAGTSTLTTPTNHDWQSEKERAIIRPNITSSTTTSEPEPVFINGRLVNASIPVATESTNSGFATPVAIVSNDAVPEGRLPNGALNNWLGRFSYGGYQHQLWEPYRIGPRTEDHPILEQGGQIEKHQDDNGIIDHYRSKWANDWNNIKRGWNNFKDSALGLVVPTSGTDVALMAAGPMFKIVGNAAKASDAIEKVGDVGRKVLTKTGKSVTIIPEGIYGSEKAAKRALTESAPFISQKSELANEAARNINGLRKWLYGGWYNATTNLPK